MIDLELGWKGWMPVAAASVLIAVGVMAGWTLRGYTGAGAAESEAIETESWDWMAKVDSDWVLRVEARSHSGDSSAWSLSGNASDVTWILIERDPVSGDVEAVGSGGLGTAPVLYGPVSGSGGVMWGVSAGAGTGTTIVAEPVTSPTANSVVTSGCGCRGGRRVSLQVAPLYETLI